MGVVAGVRTSTKLVHDDEALGCRVLYTSCNRGSFESHAKAYLENVVDLLALNHERRTVGI